jgi:diacylglycerol kinase (ATP)
VSKPGKTGFARIIDATRYSQQGLLAAWRHESAFRQECTLALLLLPFAWLLGTTLAERLLLMIVLALVLITELLNSAIEAVVDRIGDEPHPLAGRAKDMGSAAVFISLVFVVAVWSAAILNRLS